MLKKINFIEYRLLSNLCFSLKETAGAAYIAGAITLNPESVISASIIIWLDQKLYSVLRGLTLVEFITTYIPKVSGNTN